jgi:hypothetical protein
MSKGELVANCFRNRYTFQASTMQMCVLMLYNASTSYTLRQIQEVTQIEEPVLGQVIQLLTKINLLRAKAPAGAEADDQAAMEQQDGGSVTDDEPKSDDGKEKKGYSLKADTQISLFMEYKK